MKQQKTGQKTDKNPEKNCFFLSTSWFGAGPIQVELDLAGPIQVELDLAGPIQVELDLDLSRIFWFCPCLCKRSYLVSGRVLLLYYLTNEYLYNQEDLAKKVLSTIDSMSPSMIAPSSGIEIHTNKWYQQMALILLCKEVIEPTASAVTCDKNDGICDIIFQLYHSAWCQITPLTKTRTELENSR